MAFFWQTESKLKQRIDNYLEALKTCAAKFCDGARHYLEHGRDPAFLRLTKETHEAESHADDVKRESELALYTEALIPSARGDVLELLDCLDVVPNRMETTLISIEIQRVDMPAEMQDSFRKLIDLTEKTVACLVRSVNVLFEDVRRVREHVDCVSELESQVDHVEQALIAHIFESELGIGQKVLLRDVIRQAADIADAAENAAFAIELIAARRMF